MRKSIRFAFVVALVAVVGPAVAFADPPSRGDAGVARQGSSSDGFGRHGSGRHGFGPSHHREPPTEAEMREHLTARLQELRTKLGLNERQASEVRAAFEASISEMQSIRQLGRSPEARQARVELRNRTDDRIHAVLTCEQREALRKLRQEDRVERVEQRMERRGRRGQGAPGGASQGI